MSAKDKTAGSASRAASVDKLARRRWFDAALAEQVNEQATRRLAGLTGGIAPARVVEAYVDWLLNLAASPGRMAEIVESLLRDNGDLLRAAIGRAGAPDDPRYAGAGWQRWPFSLFAQAAARRDQLIELATRPLPGMSRDNSDRLRFYAQLLADALSPANLPLTNPEVIAETRRSRGRNLVAGARLAAGDVWRAVRGKTGEPAADSPFVVGETVACTPGKVIYRNRLIEVIQYTPTTPTVHAEPVLMVPAWIMKYYILDLQPQNSMIRWLVSRGHTVFSISWKNPGPEDRDLTMEDYRSLGFLDALKVVNTVVPAQKVHAVGYCVGGTLLSICAAAMARDGDDRLASITLFAAQTDFTEAGELKLFIDELSLYWLEQAMAKRGVLDSKQMGAAFALLRPRDLIWSPLVARYFLGKQGEAFDIMAWNADGTRMPQRMHADYLRQLYLDNELAQGRYRIGGRSVSLGDVRVPLFVVGTVTDHVAPWHSVYKIRNLKRLGHTSFVLTTGGHNAGIVSEPGRPRRHFQFGSWDQDSAYQSPEEWQAGAERREGSWWPTWQEWLAERSTPAVAEPPAIGNAAAGYPALAAAPGDYVRQR